MDPTTVAIDLAQRIFQIHNVEPERGAIHSEVLKRARDVYCMVSPILGGATSDTAFTEANISFDRTRPDSFRMPRSSSVGHGNRSHVDGRVSSVR
ncbi:protein of unknown function [Pararobbsia alpina]